MIGIHLINRIKADVNVNNRVYAIQGPQEVRVPFIVIQQISNIRDYTHQRYSGLQATTYRIGIYSDSLAQAKTLGGELKTSLDNWTSAIVSSAMQSAENELFEPDTKYYHLVIDYVIRWRE